MSWRIPKHRPHPIDGAISSFCHKLACAFGDAHTEAAIGGLRQEFENDPWTARQFYVGLGRIIDTPNYDRVRLLRAFGNRNIQTDDEGPGMVAQGRGFRYRSKPNQAIWGRLQAPHLHQRSTSFASNSTSMLRWALLIRCVLDLVASSERTPPLNISSLTVTRSKDKGNVANGISPVPLQRGQKIFMKSRMLRIRQKKMHPGLSLSCADWRRSRNTESRLAVQNSPINCRACNSRVLRWNKMAFNEGNVGAAACGGRT